MQQSNRLFYLDWLRIFAILGVLLFHSAMPFATDEYWHIRNKETSNLLLEFNFWLSRFRMPLLFFVSGSVTYIILRKYSASKFVGMRFKRLIIPLVFGMLVVVPPQIYLERVTQGFQGSYLDFYPQIFSGVPYPKGNTSWHHLWFIAYLFLYNLIGAPLFAWLVKRGNKSFKSLVERLQHGPLVYLLALPGILVYTLLIPIFPQTNDLIHDYAYLIYWFLFLLAGFVFIISPALLESLVRNRRTSLLIAMLSIIIINVYRWNGLEPWDISSDWRSNPVSYLILSLRGINAWFSVFALVGYAAKYLQKGSRVIGYLNEAVYPFYILHQTVIVILAYYIVQTTDTVFAKYSFLVVVSLVLSMGIYHLLIRPYKVTRFLFGMGPKKKRQDEPQPSTEAPIALTTKEQLA